MSKGCSRWEFFFTAVTLNPISGEEKNTPQKSVPTKSTSNRDPSML